MVLVRYASLRHCVCVLEFLSSIPCSWLRSSEKNLAELSGNIYWESSFCVFRIGTRMSILSNNCGPANFDRKNKLVEVVTHWWLRRSLGIVQQDLQKLRKSLSVIQLTSWMSLSSDSNRRKEVSRSTMGRAAIMKSRNHTRCRNSRSRKVER